VSVPVVSVRDVAAGYAHVPPVLRQVFLDVMPGETVALVGRNGTGKSTLLRTIRGFLEPVHGEILFKGQNIKELGPQRLASSMGFLSPSIPQAHITVDEVIELSSMGRLKTMDEFVSSDHPDVFDEVVGFGARFLDEMSSGQQRKVHVVGPCCPVDGRPADGRTGTAPRPSEPARATWPDLVGISEGQVCRAVHPQPGNDPPASRPAVCRGGRYRARGTSYRSNHTGPHGRQRARSGHEVADLRKAQSECRIDSACMVLTTNDLTRCRFILHWQLPDSSSIRKTSDGVLELFRKGSEFYQEGQALGGHVRA